jgi:hypothetical protein
MKKVIKSNEEEYYFYNELLDLLKKVKNSVRR